MLFAIARSAINPAGDTSNNKPERNILKNYIFSIVNCTFLIVNC